MNFQNVHLMKNKNCPFFFIKQRKIIQHKRVFVNIKTTTSQLYSGIVPSSKKIKNKIKKKPHIRTHSVLLIQYAQCCRNKNIIYQQQNTKLIICCPNMAEIITFPSSTHTHTHTHTYIYIYIYICICSVYNSVCIHSSISLSAY